MTSPNRRWSSSAGTSRRGSKPTPKPSATTLNELLPRISVVASRPSKWSSRSLPSHRGSQLPPAEGIAQLCTHTSSSVAYLTHIRIESESDQCSSVTCLCSHPVRSVVYAIPAGLHVIHMRSEVEICCSTQPHCLAHSTRVIRRGSSRTFQHVLCGICINPPTVLVGEETPRPSSRLASPRLISSVSTFEREPHSDSY